MNTGSHIDKSGNHHELALAADKEGNQLVGSLRRAWRSEFPGSTLNPDRWQIISQGAGQSISFAGGELTIDAGTVANEEFVMRTVGTVSIPFRAWFIGRLSQRIINQEVRLEAINATGDMVAGWLIDGTTATNAKYYSANSGNQTTSIASTVLTTATNSIFELEMFPDEFWAISRTVDSVAVRTNPYCKSQNLPDPEQDYYLQVRVKNLAIAPASNTQVIIGAVAVQDINGGRGDSVGAKAVAIAGAVTMTSGSLTASPTLGTTLNQKFVSAASTNANLLKNAATAILWITASNTSASWRFLKLYNKATLPVPGTDVPTAVIGIPPGQTITVANAVAMRLPQGLGIAITGGIADTDATAIGLNEVVVSLAFA